MQHKAPPVPLPAGDCHMGQVFPRETKKMVREGLWIAWHVLVLL